MIALSSSSTMPVTIPRAFMYCGHPAPSSLPTPFLLFLQLFRNAHGESNLQVEVLYKSSMFTPCGGGGVWFHVPSAPRYSPMCCRIKNASRGGCRRGHCRGGQTGAFLHAFSPTPTRQSTKYFATASDSLPPLLFLPPPLLLLLLPPRHFGSFEGRLTLTALGRRTARRGDNVWTCP